MNNSRKDNLFFIDKIKDFIDLTSKNKPLLGLDCGLKIIGVAITDDIQKIALPYKVISVSELDIFIKQIIDEMQIQGIICGLPLDLNSKIHNWWIDIFYLFFKNISFNIPILFIDERFSTQAANTMMQNVNFTIQNTRQDHKSATIILDNFLNLKENIKCNM